MKNLLLKACGKIDDCERNLNKTKEEFQQNKRGISTKQKLKDNLLLISFNSNSIYLNGIKLISDKSKLQQAILKILLRQHLNGYINSTSQGLNTLQIIDHLKTQGFKSEEPDKQVNQAIYGIKKKVAALYGKEISENFIMSSKYAGQYRLGENVTLICA